MIKVNLNTNYERKTLIVDEATTIRQFLEDNGVDYSVTMQALDGAPLVAGDFDKSFAEYGIADHCSLNAVTKQVNA